MSPSGGARREGERTQARSLCARPADGHRIRSSGVSSNRDASRALVLWATYAINLSTPGLIDRAGQLKGADFLQFYVMGHLAADQAVEVLYGEAAFASETRRLVPDAVETFPAVYPPQVSVLFEPFSHLSYAWAAIVWSLISISLYALACACGFAARLSGRTGT